MRSFEEIQQQISELNSNWDLTNLVVNLAENYVELQFGTDRTRNWMYGGVRRKRISFHELVDLHYRPAFIDPPPPGIFSPATLDVLDTEADLRAHEGHYIREKSIYDPYLPFYRMSVTSWEFSMDIIFGSIQVEEW